MISNEFVVKVCMDHEVKFGHKVVKKELIVALKTLKFIIIPKEDNVKPGVVLGRSFMRLTKGIANCRNGIITIYPRETKKNDDDWDLLLNDLDFGDVPEIEGVEILPFGPSFSTGEPLTQEEAAREALAIDIRKRFYILKEERPTLGTHHDEARSSRSKCSRQYETVKEAMLSCVHHPFLLWEGCSQAAKSRYSTRLAQLLSRHIYSPCVVDCNMLNHMGCGEVIDEMLTIRLCVAGTDEEIFTSKAWTRDFNIAEPIYSEICHEFYSTYEFDEVCAVDKLRTKKIIKFRLYGRAFSWTLLEFAKRSLDTTTLRELIDSKGRLILEELGVPRVAIPKSLRASMQDLYERMGSMKIRQKKKKGMWRNEAK
uniref:Uncharacterized protein n=1 Tax=Tanacetum cinerariifolium TaxID=118510 RepID=A0A699HJ12_TANCI|nr:hypothetical protein [Tanacetum cinerariifolium]